MPEGSCSIAVLSWPESLGEEGRVEAVVRAVGLDPFIAAQTVRKAPPLILARVPVSESAEAVAALEHVGAGVLLVADDDIARLPAATMVKRLIPALGSPSPMYQVEPWRAGPVETFGLDCRRVALIVRARLVSRRLGQSEPGPSPAASLAREVLLWNQPWVGDAMDAGPQVRRVSIKSAHVIDLWTLIPGPSGRLSPDSIGHVRVHGDKFSWDVLNHQKGYGDRENADRLALLLAEQCVAAQIDTGFAEFAAASARTLGRGYRSMGNGAERTEQGPIFEFYSAWSMVRLLKSMRQGQ